MTLDNLQKDGWRMFTRLAIPGKHAEAITSRPLLLNAGGKQTKHGCQTTLSVSSMHAKALQMQIVLNTLLSAFLASVRNAAVAVDLSLKMGAHSAIHPGGALTTTVSFGHDN